MKCLLASVIAISLAVIVGGIHSWAANAHRWHEPGPGVVIWCTYVFAGVLFVSLIIGAASSKRRRDFIVALILFGLLFIGATLFSRRAAASRRNAEIWEAIANGLSTDCEAVFTAYLSHPDLKRHGFIRIFPGSQEFDSLPSSIKTFGRVYVTIEDKPYRSDQPPNIGLCKNGFGGFHMGLRVFRTPPKIVASSQREPFTPTIDLWGDET
jgi:hypothetical protein